MKEAWIAAYTKARHEKVAYEKLAQKGINAYLPMIRRKRQWSDRTKWVDMPLFRSYVFVNIPLHETLYVLQTHGIHHIVKYGSEIATIPDFQIEAVRQMIEGGFEPEPTDFFAVGDEVKIVAGPLKGIEGLVTRVDTVDKLIVKIDAIQHAVAVHIDRKFLRPMKRSSASI